MSAKKMMLLMAILALWACSPTQKSIKKPPMDVFPTDWAGIWKGDLDIYKNGQLSQSLPMTLTILPQGDSIQWTIQYDTLSTRPYTLKSVDKKKGIYLVDEHNSIQLESYLFGQKLLSQYTVMGNQITIMEEKKDNTILFEVIMSKNEPVSITGGQKIGEEDIPEVKTYPVKIYQRAILHTLAP